MRHVCEFWRSTRTARGRRARSVVVVVCTLGAAFALATPGRAIASQEMPMPMGDAPARAIADTCDAPAAAIAASLQDLGPDPQQAPPPQAQDPYQDCYKDLAKELIAPFADVLPATCLGSLAEILLGRLTAATAELAAIAASDLTDAEKTERLASAWQRLRAREVFLDALVDLVKAGPDCAAQLLPAGSAVELLKDTAKLREFLGKGAEELDHQGEMGDALFRIEECVKDRLGPTGASLPTQGGGSTPGGSGGSGGSGSGSPDPGEPSSDHTKGFLGLDVHLFVADDGNLTFQGVGEFIAVKSKLDGLEIQVRQRPWANSNAASALTAVAMNVAGDRVGIYVDATPALRINGVPTALAALGSEIVRLPRGGQIRLRDGHYAIVWPDASIAHVWNQGGHLLALEVAVPPHRRGAVGGLLGDFDPTPGHYPADRAGNVIPLEGASREVYRARVYGAFGDSWRISQAESLFDYAPGEDTNTFTDRSFPRVLTRLADLSAGQRGAALDACRQAGVSNPRLLDACTEDVAITGDPWFAQAAAGVEGTSFVAPPVAPGGPGGPGDPGQTRPGGVTPAACELFTLADAQALSGSFLPLRAPKELEWPGTGRRAEQACSYIEESGLYLSVAYFRDPTPAMFSGSAFPNLRRVSGLGDDVYVSECGFPALILRGDVLVAFGVAEYFNKDGYAPNISSPAGCAAWRGKVETLVRTVVQRTAS